MMYATHIFDGLESWPTHVAYLAGGQMRMMKPAAEVPELAQGRLLQLVHKLLSEEKEAQLKVRWLLSCCVLLRCAFAACAVSFLRCLSATRSV